MRTHTDLKPKAFAENLLPMISSATGISFARLYLAQMAISH
jgi:hypothetical protein